MTALYVWFLSASLSGLVDEAVGKVSASFGSLFSGEMPSKIGFFDVDGLGLRGVDGVSFPFVLFPSSILNEV